jgi:septal ring factor EnvC (AmiA/AmiB activator)
LVAKNDRLEQQVLEGQQREKRYRTERDAARTESAKLKKEIAALEKSNDDKDRKIAALERQLAATSTK